VKVLVVDDEALIRRSLQKAFTLRGHQVAVAADGHEGIKQVDSYRPDLLILDILMPGLSGPQMLQQITRPAGMVVVLISAFAGEYDLATAKGLGADDFISKPFSDIFEVITRCEALVEDLTAKVQSQ